MTWTWSRATAVGAVLLAGAVGGCDRPAGSDSPAATSTDSPAATPTAAVDGASASGGEVWTGAMVRQASPSEDPVLCVGAILQSYPPQCGGQVRLIGWDWADVTAETVASGVTWVDTTYVVGTYADETFTLTRPPSDRPPDGVVFDSPAAAQDLPQLCEDPMRGARASAAAGIRADNRAKDALGRRLETMEGHVASWVSDRKAFMNVVVTGDAESARTEMRRYWSGRLCVEQRDVATRDDMLAALDTLMAAHLAPSQCLGGGPGTDGRLHVGVTLADPDTVATIHRLVAKHLDPDDVVITSRLRPLTR